MIVAVIWTEVPGAIFAGRLELRDATATLWGRERTGAERSESFLCHDLVDIHIERFGDDRLEGRPTLILEHRSGRRFGISPIDRVGVLGELAERFSVHSKLLTA